MLKKSPAALFIGMILRYRDNHRAGVGQFRWDWATRPVEVGSRTMLHIGFRILEGHHGNSDDFYDADDAIDANVAYLDIYSPEDRESYSSWLEIPLSGTLEWWFAPHASKIYHHSD